MARKDKERISIEDQSLLLNTASELPPYWVYANVTADQNARLSLIQEHFKDLKDALESYFLRKPNPVGRNDLKRKLLIEQEVKYFTRCYDLLWYGWDAIQAEVAATKVDGMNLFPSSPGEALCLLLQLSCQSMINSCLENTKISSHESYLLLGTVSSDASGLQKKRLVRTQQYSEEVRERVDEGKFLNFCQVAVKKRLRGNSNLKDTLEEFEQVQKKRFKYVRAILRSESIRGEKWIGGNQQEI